MLPDVTGPGGRRQVVPGAQHFCEALGKGESKVRADGGAKTDGASVEAPVERHPCVRGRSFFCSVFPRIEGGAQGVDGQAPPSHEVECDFYYAGLCG